MNIHLLWAKVLIKDRVLPKLPLVVLTVPAQRLEQREGRNYYNHPSLEDQDFLHPSRTLQTVAEDIRMASEVELLVRRVLVVHWLKKLPIFSVVVKNLVVFSVRMEENRLRVQVNLNGSIAVTGVMAPNRDCHNVMLVRPLQVLFRWDGLPLHHQSDHRQGGWCQNWFYLKVKYELKIIYLVRVSEASSIYQEMSIHILFFLIKKIRLRDYNIQLYG